MNAYHNFDWFSLNRDNLFYILYSIKDSIVGKTLTIEQCHTKVASAVRKFIPVIVKKVKDNKVEKGCIWVGGAYYSDADFESKKCISIDFAYNKNDKTVQVSNKKFLRLCSGFADTVLHEVIHMRQYRRRNWRVIPDYPSTAKRIEQREEQSYLGCRDEIDAYSFNIACELMDKFNFSEKQVIKYMNEDQRGLRRRHSSYRMYLKAFAHDHNHPVIKRLKKKVVSYIPQAKVGKPYRNSEWINY